jgi:hypothetical protein
MKQSGLRVRMADEYFVAVSVIARSTVTANLENLSVAPSISLIC